MVRKGNKWKFQGKFALELEGKRGWGLFLGHETARETGSAVINYMPILGKGWRHGFQSASRKNRPTEGGVGELEALPGLPRCLWRVCWLRSKPASVVQRPMSVHLIISHLPALTNKAAFRPPPSRHLCAPARVTKGARLEAEPRAFP